MTVPRVSVIVPCYNVAGCVGTAIESLHQQDFHDFEVIVIDDGSTDGTAAEVHRAIGADPRFRVVSQANLGLSCARNTGIELAQGDYLAFLDGDDWFAPDFLSTMVQALAQSGADWAACAIWLDYPDGTSAPHSAIHGAPIPTGPARRLDLTDACQIARLFPSAWNKLYRRNMIGQHRFQPGAIYEDQPFFWNLACRTSAIWYVPHPLYHHRRGRPGQITAQGTRQIFQQFNRLEEVRSTLATAPKRNKATALSRLATRLFHERLHPVTDKAIRTEFLNRADQFFRTHGLRWDWDGTNDLSLTHMPQSDPGLRVTVLVQGGPVDLHMQQALDRQTLPVWAVAPVAAGPVLTVLRQAQKQHDTAWIAILQSGDVPHRDWCATMVHALRTTPNAQLVICATTQQDGMVYDRSHVLSFPTLPCADPAAILMSRDADLPDHDNLPSWTTALRMAHRGNTLALAGDGEPLVTLAARDRLGAVATARTVQALRSGGLVESAQAMALYAHMAQLAVLARQGRPARVAEALCWAAMRRLARLPKGPVGPHIGVWLRRML